MIEINLSVLFVESIPSRVYLALLKKHGYQPKKIIYLDIDHQSPKHKTVKKLLGKRVADRLSALSQWLRGKKIPEKLSKSLLSGFGISMHDITSCLESYPDSLVDKIKVTSLDDAALRRHIESSESKTYLFTGGGILRDSLLSLEGVRFIHVHPGIVPEVRGADCFFWSYLLRKKAGYSVFYMNEGIDTGDVLFKKEFDVHLTDYFLKGYRNEIFYLAILQYYDPYLRIRTLIEFFDRHIKYGQVDSKEFDLQSFESIKQDQAGGRTFFFMHRRLRNFAVNLLKYGTR